MKPIYKYKLGSRRDTNTLVDATHLDVISMSRHIQVADVVYLGVDAQIEIMRSAIIEELFQQLWAPKAIQESYHPTGSGDFR